MIIKKELYATRPGAINLIDPNLYACYTISLPTFAWPGCISPAPYRRCSYPTTSQFAATSGY
jgi:hypothetical protein